MVLLNENFLVLVAGFVFGLLHRRRCRCILVLRPVTEGVDNRRSLRAVYHVG